MGTKDDSVLDDYGAQLSPLAVSGVKPEGSVSVTWTEQRGAFADGVAWSLRTPAYKAEHWEYGAPSAEMQLSPRMLESILLPNAQIAE